MIPKFQSLPVFSEDPVQNAEMTAEYLFECRLMGQDPYYAGDTDDDYPEDEYEYEGDDDYEEE